MRLILSLLTILTLGTGLACNNAAKPVVVKNEPANTEKVVVKNEPAKIEKKVDSHGHADEAPRITLAEAKKEFDAGTAIFVDTRDMVSYRNSHIKGAINIPMETVQMRWKEIPLGKKIIAYCS